MKQNTGIVEINREPIELYKILKIGDMALSGGEAKQAIVGGLVLLNGTVETRKGKKIVAGDVIEYEGIKLRVMLKRKTDSIVGLDGNTNQ